MENKNIIKPYTKKQIIFLVSTGIFGIGAVILLMTNFLTESPFKEQPSFLILMLFIIVLGMTLIIRKYLGQNNK
ncbi:MAG: hypothetical protein ABIW47_15085 [Ginsengibacter sp.]|jgi:nicotinamide riboside transporter PnuC